MLTQVRALDMDATKGELRALLRAEKDSLLQQVELARLRLEDATEYRRQVVERPLPSVKDMRELEHKLEKMSVAPQSALLDLMRNVPLGEEAAPRIAPEPLRESPKKARQVRSSASPSPGICLSPGAAEHTPTPPPGPPKRHKKREGGSQGEGKREGKEGASNPPGKRQQRTQMAMSIDCADVRKAPADIC